MTQQSTLLLFKFHLDNNYLNREQSFLTVNLVQGHTYLVMVRKHLGPWDQLPDADTILNIVPP